MAKPKRIWVYILPTLILLGAIEGGFRIYHSTRGLVEPCQPANDWWQYDATIGWKARPGFSGIMFEVSRSFDKQGFLSVDSPQITNVSKRKILLIGDSCTFGHGVAAENTYGEVLEQLLPDYEVINLALPGYTTFQGALALREHIARLSPALVIISFGFNDRRYVLGPELIDSAPYFKQIYRLGGLIPRLARYSTAVRYVFKIARGADPCALNALPESGREVQFKQLLPRVAPGAYQQNLMLMAGLAGQHQAEVVFLSLADSPRRALKLYEGYRYYRQGDHRAAIETLGPVAFGGSAFSTLARRFAIDIMEQHGQAVEVNNYNTIKQPMISLHGGKPLFLDLEYSSAMKEAAEASGALYVDGRAALLRHPEYFMDFTHFNENGHRLIAELLAGAIGNH